MCGIFTYIHLVDTYDKCSYIYKLLNHIPYMDAMGKGLSQIEQKPRSSSEINESFP